MNKGPDSLRRSDQSRKLSLKARSQEGLSVLGHSAKLLNKSSSYDPVLQASCERDDSFEDRPIYSSLFDKGISIGNGSGSCQYFKFSHLHTSAKLNSDQQAASMRNSFVTTSSINQNEARPCYTKTLAESHSFLSSGHPMAYQLCKGHYIQLLTTLMRKHFIKTYRHSDLALASMDMPGNGFVFQDVFIENLAVQRSLNEFNTLHRWQKPQNYARPQESRPLLTSKDVAIFCRLQPTLFQKINPNMTIHEVNTSTLSISVNKQKNRATSLNQSLNESQMHVRKSPELSFGFHSGEGSIVPDARHHNHSSFAIGHQAFKQTFFPHLCHGAQIPSPLREQREQKTEYTSPGIKSGAGTTKKSESSLERRSLNRKMKETQGRLMEIERVLRQMFGDNFNSVRKAFLYLDSDRDGLVTVEDFFMNFNKCTDMNYEDLITIIKKRDSKGKGTLNYQDFSQWVGARIHQTSGFYFRHDSCKNPGFEASVEKVDERIREQEDQLKARNEGADANLKKLVIEKIKFQWTTLKKAFRDLHKEPSRMKEAGCLLQAEKLGGITKEELRFYLNHWGLKLSDRQFEDIYAMLDLDGDGIISYKDFTGAVGPEIHPGEGLYFRSSLESLGRNSKKEQAAFRNDEAKCSQIGCLLPRAPPLHEKDTSYLCRVHQQMSLPVLQEAATGLSRRSEVQRMAQGNRKAKRMQNLIQKVSLGENEEDDARDAAGYTGDIHRHLKERYIKHKQITLEEFIAIVKKENKLAEFFKIIKTIDRDHNGFITQTEMDDILKLLYRSQLNNVNLKPVYLPFVSYANKVLVDYKKFRDYLLKALGLAHKQPQRLQDTNRSKSTLGQERSSHRTPRRPGGQTSIESGRRRISSRSAARKDGRATPIEKAVAANLRPSPSVPRSTHQDDGSSLFIVRDDPLSQEQIPRKEKVLNLKPKSIKTSSQANLKRKLESLPIRTSDSIEEKQAAVLRRHQQTIPTSSQEKPTAARRMTKEETKSLKVSTKLKGKKIPSNPYCMTSGPSLSSIEAYGGGDLPPKALLSNKFFGRRNSKNQTALTDGQEDIAAASKGGLEISMISNETSTRVGSSANQYPLKVHQVQARLNQSLRHSHKPSLSTIPAMEKMGSSKLNVNFYQSEAKLTDFEQRPSASLLTTTKASGLESGDLPRKRTGPPPGMDESMLGLSSDLQEEIKLKIHEKIKLQYLKHFKKEFNIRPSTNLGISTKGIAPRNYKSILTSAVAGLNRSVSPIEEKAQQIFHPKSGAESHRSGSRKKKPQPALPMAKSQSAMWFENNRGPVKTASTSNPHIAKQQSQTSSEGFFLKMKQMRGGNSREKTESVMDRKIMAEMFKQQKKKSQA